MTPLNLLPIKARLEAASPGRWSVSPSETPGYYQVQSFTPGFRLFSSREGYIAFMDADGPRGMNKWNAELVAHAPTDIRALIEEVERLRALVPNAH